MTSTPSVRDSTPRRSNKMASNQPTNLNHLLNFSLPPRESRPASSIPRRSRKTANTQGVWNKERFINAQYRFVMNPTGDYTVHFADPDIYFQWNDILQVIVPRSSPFASAGGDAGQGDGHTTCPICLSPPTAPRMTKCGHIYCFPCILHYLSTSENKWARCPICFDSVNAKQLKCVKWYDGPTDLSSVAPRAGSMLEMRLIQRPQITTLALPRSETWPSDLLPPHQAPFHFLPDVLNFSKFMLATPDYLISELTRDRDQLAEDRRMMEGMEDPLGSYFIDAADEQVQHQIAKAAALDSSALRMQTDKAERDEKDIRERAANRPSQAAAVHVPVPTELLATRSTPATIAPTPTHHNPRSQGRQRRNLNPPPPSTSTYYYYQAASGLPIFLHPVDIKILLSHFNGYASFPNTITVRVESASESTVNDDLRKRCKYLAHMPEGADVIFIEADLEGVVGVEGLKNFEGPLRLRAKKREDKVKKDDRAKARAEEREKEKEREALARFTHSPVYPRNDFNPQEFVSLATSSQAGESDQGSVSASPPQTSGVWGQRSFASALHSSSPPTRSGQQQGGRRLTQEEEWEADAMWHDLEQATLNSAGGGGGRKKKGSRMVVLGSGPGLRRR